MPKFRFVGLGGTNEVGASSYLYEIGKENILIDVGVRTQVDGEASLPSLGFLEGHPPDLILLTHAHIDHIGALPIVHKMFPKTPIFSTPITKELTLKVLTNSVQTSQNGGQSLFTQDDVLKSIQAIKEIHPGKDVSFGWGKVTPQVAGHIPGAVTLLLESEDKRVLHTGDFQNVGMHTIDPVYRPKEPLRVEAVVTESTHGDVLLPNQKKQIRSLVEKTQKILARGGRILVPSFALGRAQEILLILLNAMQGKLIPTVPIYLDGLVREITDTYSNNLQTLPKSIQNMVKNSRINPFFAKNVIAINNDTRTQILEKREPMIIICSGASLFSGVTPLYARYILEEESSTLFAVGFKDAENPDDRLLSRNKGDIVNLPLEKNRKVQIAVRADIEHYYLSTHADRVGITSFLSSYPSNHVVLVHGQTQARQSLKETLIDNTDVHTPSAGEWVDLVAPRIYGPSVFDKELNNIVVPEIEELLSKKKRVKTFGASAALKISGNQVIIDFPKHLDMRHLLGEVTRVAVKIRLGEKFSMTMRPQDEDPKATTIEERMVYIEYVKKLMGKEYEAWLSKPNKLLNWSSPSELLRTREGAAWVVKVVESESTKETKEVAK